MKLKVITAAVARIAIFLVVTIFVLDYCRIRYVRFFSRFCDIFSGAENFTFSAELTKLKLDKRLTRKKLEEFESKLNNEVSKAQQNTVLKLESIARKEVYKV